ncbi:MULTISPECIES: PepSY domain-containing protein [unclassified Pseudomonas]|uniref:PepSY domain-containing protein n=1 Tax=unclassified Pseudomonas TaxID=196821 RepID=UPI000BDBF092|nr:MULTISPECIES: PepSY domain-containing protein [unclassified Pseudomonas]PVZ19416.1 peptidase YpeB-like protein [Pseudomonas sp. URIL14HWK12:I12]PVZ22999.1 peptidase YpeB-like protein [Pseudomonas sp. URIL14HWK12:I10]PVZ37371.1 peptidase YpeB-like protein [Pseudomonas sp. URIL14HWK12:I11]SNZ14596.1 Peptidase propeptide and YPEB domain-containing protein [Pseudomonas sp. URIL14HWK12:I9]
MRRYLLAFWAMQILLCSELSLAHDLGQDEALKLRQQGLILPLEQLLASAMARYPDARLLEAELERDDGQYIYEVELLTASGVVREIELDAATGRLLKDKEDD